MDYLSNILESSFITTRQLLPKNEHRVMEMRGSTPESSIVTQNTIPSPGIVQPIMTFLRGDKASLFTCALVCRSWLPEVRRLLFSALSVDFFTSFKLESFITFLESSPAISMHIRCLTLVGHEHSGNHAQNCSGPLCSHAIARIMMSCPSIKSLHLRFGRYCHAPRSSPVAFADMLKDSVRSIAGRKRMPLPNPIDLCKFHIQDSQTFKLSCLEMDASSINNTSLPDLLDILHLFSELKAFQPYRRTYPNHVLSLNQDGFSLPALRSGLGSSSFLQPISNSVGVIRQASVSAWNGSSTSVKNFLQTESEIWDDPEITYFPPLKIGELVISGLLPPIFSILRESIRTHSLTSLTMMPDTWTGIPTMGCLLREIGHNLQHLVIGITQAELTLGEIYSFLEFILIKCMLLLVGCPHLWEDLCVAWCTNLGTFHFIVESYADKSRCAQETRMLKENKCAPLFQILSQVAPTIPNLILSIHVSFLELLDWHRLQSMLLNRPRLRGVLFTPFEVPGHVYVERGDVVELLPALHSRGIL